MYKRQQYYGSTAVQEVDNAMSSYKNSIKQIVACREMLNQGKEAFMKDVKWVNNLKLRASYGETGNDNICLLYTSRCV